MNLYGQGVTDVRKSIHNVEATIEINKLGIYAWYPKAIFGLPIDPRKWAILSRDDIQLDLQ